MNRLVEMGTAGLRKDVIHISRYHPSIPHRSDPNAQENLPPYRLADWLRHPAHRDVLVPQLFVTEMALKWLGAKAKCPTTPCSTNSKSEFWDWIHPNPIGYRLRLRRDARQTRHRHRPRNVTDGLHERLRQHHKEGYLEDMGLLFMIGLPAVIFGGLRVGNPPPERRRGLARQPDPFHAKQWATLLVMHAHIEILRFFTAATASVSSMR